MSAFFDISCFRILNLLKGYVYRFTLKEEKNDFEEKTYYMMFALYVVSG